MVDVRELNLKLWDFERKFKTYLWRLNGVDLWPVVKMVLAFEFEEVLRKRLEEKESIFSRTFFLKILAYMKRRIGQIVYFLLTKKEEVKQCDFLFASFPSYRELYKGYSRDKFFDAFMDFLAADNQTSGLFEFEVGNQKDLYKKDRISVVGKSLFTTVRNEKYDWSDLENIEGFVDVLADFCCALGVNKEILHSKIISTCDDIIGWKSVSSKLLKTSQPKVIFLASYYSIPMFGLLLSAKEMGIPTVEIQHGGLDEWHYCYNFQSDNFYGLNTLPEKFWMWSVVSHDVIRKWAASNDLIKVIDGGNPWVEFLMNEPSDLNFEGRDLALFTLQTGVYPLIPQFILNAINEGGDNLVWVLRFHPRMTLHEIKIVRELVKKGISMKRVFIDQYKDTPLPLLLKKARVHISAFSGSLLEAKIIGVPINITFHPIGKNAYSKLIDEGQIYYFDSNESIRLIDFLEKLKAVNIHQVEQKVDLNKYFKGVLEKLGIN